MRYTVGFEDMDRAEARRRGEKNSAPPRLRARHLRSFLPAQGEIR